MQLLINFFNFVHSTFYIWIDYTRRTSWSFPRANFINFASKFLTLGLFSCSPSARCQRSIWLQSKTIEKKICSAFKICYIWFQLRIRIKFYLKIGSIFGIQHIYCLQTSSDTCNFVIVVVWNHFGMFPSHWAEPGEHKSIRILISAAFFHHTILFQ